MKLNLQLFGEFYSPYGDSEDRADSFKLAATAVHKDADLDRPFTGDETRAMFAAADAADAAASGGTD